MPIASLKATADSAKNHQRFPVYLCSVSYTSTERNMGKTTVILVEDHEVIREGLRALLQTQPDIEVVGEAGDGRAAVTMVRYMSPNVVVMDVSLPEQNGHHATLQITKASKETR